MHVGRLRAAKAARVGWECCIGKLPSANCPCVQDMGLVEAVRALTAVLGW
jgi:hypothetical protein